MSIDPVQSLADLVRASAHKLDLFTPEDIEGLQVGERNGKVYLFDPIRC